MYSRGVVIPGLLTVYPCYACFLSVFEIIEACFVLWQRKTAKRLKRIPPRRKLFLCRKVHSRRECAEHHDKACLKEKRKKEKSPEASKNTLFIDWILRREKKTATKINCGEKQPYFFFACSETDPKILSSPSALKGAVLQNRGAASRTKRSATRCATRKSEEIRAPAQHFITYFSPWCVL